MNSKLLIVCAIVLLFGAAVIGWLGLSLTPAPNQTSTAAATADFATIQDSVQTEIAAATRQVEDSTRTNVIVISRDISAHSLLTEDDIIVERLLLQPPDSFSDPQQVVGRRIWRDLPGGTILNSSSFDAGGPLARMIRNDERAMAIEINEVVGAGGYLRPGDYVDVLLYLQDDGLNADRTAQVAVPALRVLSVGAELGATLNGESAALPAAANETAAQRQPQSARTAVLAVPESLLTRFALATDVGRIKLAVRSAEEGKLEQYYSSDKLAIEKLNAQLFRFEQVAVSTGPRTQAPQPVGIPVHRGSALTHEAL
jgi:pilus assembly protein CpaB